MRAGASNAVIAQQLVSMGVDAHESSRVVDTVSTELIRVTVQQRPTPLSVFSGFVGGMLAAFIGGVVWGVIVKLTDHEIGYMAWGLGLLVGCAVALFARGKKGYALQSIAVVTSILGIALGKYVVFADALRRVVLERLGPEQASHVTMLSAKVFAFFLQSLASMLSPYDALWVVLAVVTAWRVPKGTGIKIPAQVIHE